MCRARVRLKSTRGSALVHLNTSQRSIKTMTYVRIIDGNQKTKTVVYRNENQETHDRCREPSRCADENMIYAPGACTSFGRHSAVVRFITSNTRNIKTKRNDTKPNQTKLNQTRSNQTVTFSTVGMNCGALGLTPLPGYCGMANPTTSSKQCNTPRWASR